MRLIMVLQNVTLSEILFSQPLVARVPSVNVCDCVVTDDEGHDPEISTTPSQIIDGNLSEWQSTEELTTLHQTHIMTTSVSGHPRKKSTVGIYTLGTFLLVVLILLVILFVAWSTQYKKRRTLSQASNQQLQMRPVDTFNQSPSSGDHVELDTAGTVSGAEGDPFENRPGNTFRDVTTHEEDSCHIYQDAAEAYKGASQPSCGEQISPDAFSSQINMDNTVSTSLASVNIPNIRHYSGIEGISPYQMEDGYEDCTYQDVDFDRNNGVKESASGIPGRARLFDDTCYNALNFANRSDSVFSKSQDPRIASVSNAKREPENESAESCKSGDFAKSKNVYNDCDYDHINHAFHDDRAEVHDPTHPSLCPTSQPDFHSYRKENISCSNIASRTTAPSEDVYYFQLDPGVPKDIETSNRPFHPDVFDSSEYSLLNSKKDSIDIRLPDKRESDNFTVRHDTESPIREELYARVNKTRGTALSPKPSICEELYAKVDKTKKWNVEAKQFPEDLHANETKGPSLSDDPVIGEELYANVDKTRDSCTADTKPAFSEEVYMNFTDI
ncbi:uncharacterized protein [Diadema antillarum]|uniref:uncharacterized protein n=1 Tax=Diadema antillarum TaxID=105358 RepID=UPI003A857BF0